MHENRFATHSLRDPRVLRILTAALEAVEPGAAVRRYLADHPLDVHQRLFGLGIGKASVPMLEALAGLYPLEDGLAITKYASPYGEDARGTDHPFTVMEGGHPVPDARSLAAGQRVVEFAGRLRTDDLLICLISGGGSALVSAPRQGLTLEDTQALTSALLACGARIDEINTLRRPLDRLKGGGLVRVANKAQILSLILSDVVGNSLEAIASGPTAPDPSTRADALAILEKYNLKPVVPATILKTLLSASGNLRAADPAFDRVQNLIVADNLAAAQAAQQQAREEGFQAEVLTTELQGEARDVGRALARHLRAASTSQRRPFCLIAGGETTVTLTPFSSPHRLSEKNTSRAHGGVGGKGGRNQELGLAAVSELAGADNVLLIALATDGDDGPTDAAGAVVGGNTAQRAESLGLDAADYLSRNDAYSYFEALGDLLKPGYTGTNVNDLIFLIGY